MKYDNVSSWEMKGRVMYIDGVVLDRKVRSFSYNCFDDHDLITINCYVECDGDVVIKGDEAVMESIELRMESIWLK